MKQWFFTALLVAIPVSLGVGLIWMLAHGIYTLISDWRLGREIEELRSESSQKREQRRKENLVRLQNGCEHEFGGGFELFPRGVCHKCGLAMERPTGKCDHVWRLAKDATPHTFCEKCGQRYLGTVSSPAAI